STSSQPQSVVVQGRYAFVGGATGRGFQIFDISNPSAITIVSNLTLPGGVYIDGVQGRYAYVSQPSSLYIYDISNPYSPQVASITATTSSPGGLIQGRYFYYVSPAS